MPVSRDAGRSLRASMAIVPPTAAASPETSNVNDDVFDLPMPTVPGSPFSYSSHDGEEQTISGHNHTELMQQHSSSVQDTLKSARHKLTHGLDCMDQKLWDGIPLTDFLAHIAAERLARMPHSGSQWDKTLKDAESFAIHIDQYQRMVKPLDTESLATAELMWAVCRLLLELGASQTAALEKAFAILYILSLDLMTFLKYKKILEGNGEAKQELGNAYADILSLLVDLAISYQHSVLDDPTAVLDVDSYPLFDTVALKFRSRKQQLVDLIWDHQLQGTTVDHRLIRDWLLPQDYYVRDLVLPSAFGRYHPGSMCDWFYKPLTGFLKGPEKALQIVGKPGSGKTTLCSWTLDTLQRRVLAKAYTTLAYSIDSSIVVESSPNELVRGLLSQILQQSIGNTEMIQRVSAAYEKTLATDHEAELILWQTLDAAIRALGSDVSLTTIVVLDGLDAIAGGEVIAVRTWDRLCGSIASVPNVKLLGFGRFGKSTMQLPITAEKTFHDVSRMAKHLLAPSRVFSEQQHDRRAAIVERIARTANGSFVWADLVVGLLSKENTLDGLLRTLEKAPKTVPSLVQRILSSLDADVSDIKNVLSWLTVALRPLSLQEVQLLLGSTTRKQVASATPTSVADNIVHSSGNLLVSQRGSVRFRNNVVRDSLVEMSVQGRGLLPVKDAHSDMTLRLLTMARLDHSPYDTPTTDFPSLDPRDLLTKQTFLEYTARYWVAHFCRSSMYTGDNDYIVPSSIKKNFPSVVSLAVLEGISWTTNHFMPSPLRVHRIALGIRCEALGGSSLPVLQSRINLAMILERNGDLAAASLQFYEAAMLGQELLGISSIVTGFCASHYLECTGRTTTTEAAGLPSHREQVLKLLVETSKHQCGSKSDHVVMYQKALGDFYSAQGNSVAAVEVFDKLHDLILEIYGSDSHEAKSINAKLAAALRRINLSGGDTMQYVEKLFLLSRQTMNEADSRRVNATLRMAEGHQARGDYASAEILLVELWKKVTDASLENPTVDNQKLRFGVATAYINFLHQHKRDAEATTLLLALWIEAEQLGEGFPDQSKQIQGMLQSSGYDAVPLLVDYTNPGQRQKALDAYQQSWQNVLGGGVKTMAPDTVQAIYGRYRTALGQAMQGNSDYTTLRDLAQQYYEVCTTLFQPRSSITLKAALELAEANAQETSSQAEATRLYRQITMAAAPDSAGSNDDPQIANLSRTADARLATLYRTMSSTSSNHLSEVIDDAISFYSQRYETSKASLELTDDRLWDDLTVLIHLYTQKGATTNTASSDLLKSLAADIISNETSPIRLMELAGKLVNVYSGEGYSEQGADLVDTLRRQFFLEDAIKDDDSALHRSLDPRCYIFIVTLEGGLSKPGKQTCSHTMPDLLYENLCYKQCVESDLKGKLYWGIRLHEILRANNRSREADALEKLLFKAIFGATSASSAQPSKQIMWTMLSQILDQLSDHKTDSANEAISSAGIDIVESLMKDEDFGEAYAVANTTVAIASSLNALGDRQSVASGMRLALHMASAGLPDTAMSEDLRRQMRSLSHTVLREVLNQPQKLRHYLGQANLVELKEIINLLGNHKAYAELEELLSVLWSSHATQKSWTPDDIIWFGRRFVEVQFARGNKDAAIEQCEAIIYNLTTLWGPLDPTTVEMSLVLSGLYIATERYQDAMVVHEDILCLILATEDDSDRAEAAPVAKQHFEEIRRLHQLSGDWFGAFSRFSELGHRLLAEFGDEAAWEGVEPLTETSSRKPTVSPQPEPEAEQRPSQLSARKAHRCHA